MHGRVTGIVLGAGASLCYSGATSGIPTQQDIVGRLFFGADATGSGFPSFSDTFGIRHSFPLAKYLRGKFDLTENPTKPHAKMDFWTTLQERGMSLESLYAEIEADSDAPRRLLDDFESIVRAAVLAPTGERQASEVCKYHRLLCEALDPGDYVISFNWDTAMADALLYYSHFWFPFTGFGVPVLGRLLAPSQKSHPAPSAVTLLHVHGSAALFEPCESIGTSRQGVVFVGPRQWSTGDGLRAIMGIEPGRAASGSGPEPMRESTEEEEDRAAKGWLFLRGRWFQPIFVPPSRHKAQYASWYCTEVRRRIHSLLPDTERLVFAGYSFPEADQAHLERIFVDRVLRQDLEVLVVNPQNSDESFRSRVRTVLPSAKIDFAVPDFRQYCESLRFP